MSARELRALGTKGKSKDDSGTTRRLTCSSARSGMGEPSRRPGSGGCSRRGREKVRRTDERAGESYKGLSVDTAAFEGHRNGNRKPQATGCSYI